eukprot:TRINITY_DN13501_c0_g1_i1.p3 TRINITY_DN13501_c0_g1~~TRINITY_DN13501_c0_g1_i1.p3  ORF type:complete len:121 (+),score=15.14 TRINITY_DN13501_c0_g1_i1:501-863(+)
MTDIVSRFKADVNFLTVYQKEAHPEGGWEAPDQPNVVKEATSTEDRLLAARDFFGKTRYAGQHAVDGIENDATMCYDAMPDRIFVIDPQHRFVHVQPRGPPGYQPSALAEFLEKTVGKGR